MFSSSIQGLLVLALGSHGFVSAAPQVRVGRTSIIGANGPAKTEFFGGIPFAKPPVGNLRFRPPVGITTLSGATFNASQFGAPCLQTIPVPGMAEDCLTLNVYRPHGVDERANLPVMAWIYGGGFAQGFSSMYNATLLVAQSVARGTPIIFVSMNYRLGALGFPTGSEAQSRGALNLGLKDQLAALKWIQTNIGAFGGDKDKVTLFGESAGAISVADLFLNSKLETLIRAAILESGSQSTTDLVPASSRTTLWQSFAKAVPTCSSSNLNQTFSCLQEATSDEIMAAELAVAGTSFVFLPVIDGPGGVIPALPSALLQSGSFSKIPFITGTNLDDGTLFTSTTVNSTEALRASLLASLSSIGGASPALLQIIVDGLLELYPDDPAAGSPFGTGNDTFGLPSEFKRAAAIEGDILFQALRRAWINAAASRGVKTFGYLFTDPQTLAFAPGVAHASELAYVYGMPLPGIPFQQTPGFAALSQQMRDYWISFAASLTPNDGKGSKRPVWPQFTPTNQVLIQLDSRNLSVIPDTYRADQLAFINLLPQAFGH